MSEQIGDRIRNYALQKCPSIRAFESTCGLTNGVVQRCSKGMNSDNIARILTAFPDIDLKWLILGIKSTPHTNIPPQEDSVLNSKLKAENDRLWEIVRTQQETINNLINVNVHINNI